MAQLFNTLRGVEHHAADLRKVELRELYTRGLIEPDWDEGWRITDMGRMVLAAQPLVSGLDVIAVVSPNPEEFERFMRGVDPLSSGHYVRVSSMGDVDGKQFTRIVRACMWFGDDLMVACEGGLCLWADQ